VSHAHVARALAQRAVRHDAAVRVRACHTGDAQTQLSALLALDACARRLGLLLVQRLDELTARVVRPLLRVNVPLEVR
jgi:hypothetical protein